MKLFYASDEQQKILLGMIRDVAQKLVALDFTNPEQDDGMIRHHAYLKGKLSILQQLMADDFEDPAPATQPKENQA